MSSLPSDFVSLGGLNATRTVLFVCDIQEKFRSVIHNFDKVLRNAKKLIDAITILEMPLIVTEQYPQGLGATVAELDISHAVAIVPKTKFSMWVPEVEKALDSIQAKGSRDILETIILLGVESHVCIEQTAIELIGRGYKVHIVADATSSRSVEDRDLAFQRLRQIGCFVTTCETVIFKLIKDKNHEKFNDIKSIVKNGFQ